jgi:hypothetical protein
MVRLIFLKLGQLLIEFIDWMDEQAEENTVAY